MSPKNISLTFLHFQQVEVVVEVVASVVGVAEVEHLEEVRSYPTRINAGLR